MPVGLSVSGLSPWWWQIGFVKWVPCPQGIAELTVEATFVCE